MSARVLVGQPKPGDHWLEITAGMSGHFAVEVWLNPEMGGFVEPWQTGIGRYATPLEAYQEAKVLAETEDLPYVRRPDLEQ